MIYIDGMNRNMVIFSPHISCEDKEQSKKAIYITAGLVYITIH